MTNDTIFTLNAVDYSAYVVASEYKVNLQDVFQEWTDGGQTKHKDIIGQRLSGTMKMYFDTATHYQAFLTALSACKRSDNTYPVQLKANNDTVESLVSKNVWLTFEPVRKRNAVWDDVFEIIEVTIEEPTC